MYKQATGKQEEGALNDEVVQEEEEEVGVKKRIPQEGDSCPICCVFLFSRLEKQRMRELMRDEEV